MSFIKLVKPLSEYNSTVTLPIPSESVNVPIVTFIEVSVLLLNIGAVIVVGLSLKITEFVSKSPSTENVLISLLSPSTTYRSKLAVIFVFGVKPVTITFSSKLVTLSVNVNLYIFAFTVTRAGKSSVFLMPSVSLHLIFPVALSEDKVPTCINVQVVTLLFSKPESPLDPPPQAVKTITISKPKAPLIKFFIITFFFKLSLLYISFIKVASYSYSSCETIETRNVITTKYVTILP